MLIIYDLKNRLERSDENRTILPKIGKELITMKFFKINFECLKYLSLFF